MMPCLPTHPGARLACVTVAMRAAVWGAPCSLLSRLLHFRLQYRCFKCFNRPYSLCTSNSAVSVLPSVQKSFVHVPACVVCAKQGTRACEASRAEQDCCAPAHMEEDPLFNSPDTKIRYEAYRQAASTCVSGTSGTSANERVAIKASGCVCPHSRLQAACSAFGEELPIPEIVAIGGQARPAAPKRCQAATLHCPPSASQRRWLHAV
jgi:hypothetical protein